jgi:multidrug efflux system outer membrane protein
MRNFRLLCLALALALPVAGCVGPSYERPPIEVPQAWRESDAANPAAEISPDWWRGFASDELNRLIERASTASFDIRAATARIRQAEAQAEISGASLFPTLNASASGTRTKSPSTRLGTSSTGAPVQSDTRITNSFRTSLSAAYELDFWGKNLNAARAGRASLLATRYAGQTVRMTTLSTVATTYFQILALRERVALARAQLVDAEDVLRGIELRARVGVATELDVAQQRTLVEGERAAIPALERQLSQQIDSLGVLLGMLPQQITIDGQTLDGIAAPAVEVGLPSTLLNRRPDVAQAEEELIAGNANLRTAIASLFPSVSLTATGGYSSQMLDTLINPASRLWSIGTSLAQTIFDGGRLSGQVSQQRGRVEELTANYQKAVVQAFSDVEDALSAVRRSAEQRAAQEKVTEAAAEAYRAAEFRLRAGTIDTTTLLDAQRTLFNAKDSLANARLDYLQTIVTLYRVLGGGWSVQTAEKVD